MKLTSDYQPPTTVVMGTRGSPLALAQARQFARALEAAHENLVVEERIIRTTGDKIKPPRCPRLAAKVYSPSK
jgi:porphobilinogen deaminase